MADTASSALLQNMGERMKINIGDEAVRSNLFKLVGEKQKKRIIEAKEAASQDLAEMPTLPVLDEEEQDIAQLQIQELHPLYDTPSYEAFPWLCACLRLCPKDKKNKENAKMRENFIQINQRLNKIIERAEG